MYIYTYNHCLESPPLKNPGSAPECEYVRVRKRESIVCIHIIEVTIKEKVSRVRRYSHNHVHTMKTKNEYSGRFPQKLVIAVCFK